MQKSPRHAAALKYAAEGIPIFPCVPDGKAPATPNGFHDASTDPAIIDAWWAEADYNVALSPADAGWGVVDIDGPEGEDAWTALEAIHDIPSTFTVQTPRGGRHLYFDGELPTSAWSPTSKKGRWLGVHIDTRGVGSYVLVPPSTVNGKPYTTLNADDLAMVPDWMQEKLRRRDHIAEAPDVNLDLPGNVERARVLLETYVKNEDVAIEGRGGDARTYRLACEVINLGLSPETAHELITEIWNPHCLPPWDAGELGVKIENASRYAQNEAGAWAVSPAAEVFAGGALDQLLRDSKQPATRSRFHAENEAEQEEGEDPKWLIKDLIQENSTVLLVGPSGSFKSFVALDVALSVSTGTETFGTSPLKGSTFYAAAEGRTNLKRPRRRAWKIGRGVEKADDFYVMPAPMLALPEDVQAFGDEIRRRCGGKNPRIIVLDTLAKVMAGLNENDASDAGKFIRLCDSLVEAFPGVAVIAIHHTGKDEGRGARGSSAFFAGFDTVLEVKRHKPKAVEVWVRKHKDAEEREAPWTFEARTIGPSLVLFPTTEAEHRAMVATDELDGKKVGAALKALGARGRDRAVVTNVLAAQLMPAREGDSVEAREALHKKTAQTLNKLARSRFEAYHEVDGRDRIWFLPEPEAE